jgi:hypothetical protein
VEEIRVLNFALSALAAMFLWVYFNDRPAGMPLPQRLIRHTIVAGYGLAAWGSLEHLARGSDFTFVSIAWAVHCVVLLGVLWRIRHHH